MKVTTKFMLNLNINGNCDRTTNTVTKHTISFNNVRQLWQEWNQFSLLLQFSISTDRMFCFLSATATVLAFELMLQPPMLHAWRLKTCRLTIYNWLNILWFEVKHSINSPAYYTDTTVGISTWGIICRQVQKLGIYHKHLKQINYMNILHRT